MHKYRYLFKNIGLLTISNFGTKILSFVLIPIYTSVLSTGDYGTYDIYSTTISLLIPIFTFNIVEAVIRFTLEKDTCAVEVFSVGLRRAILSILLFSSLVILNYVLNMVSIFRLYAEYFVLLFSGSLIYSLLSQFSRGIERVSDVAIAGALNSITMLSMNVVLLVYIKKGLEGYFIANCCAYLIPIIYLSFRLKIWDYINININKSLKSEMFSYSKPLVFNTVSWWINNVSDRYIVTWICGVAANGIYSVAYKIPSVLNVFQSIFSQAWTLSAVKEFDNDSEEFYGIIYKVYNCILVIICSFLILGDKIIARLLFANEFYYAWKYAPFLMISTVFGSLSGMLGGIFSAAKKSKIFAKTTVVGASVNTVLNIFLVFLIGPLGAAIATLISYGLVWFTRYKETRKIIRFNVAIKRDVISYTVLLLQSIILLSELPDAINYSIETGLCILIIVLNAKDIHWFLKGILGKLNSFLKKRTGE